MSGIFQPESLDVRRSLAAANLAESADVLKEGAAANRGALLNRMARDHATLGLHAYFREGNQAGLKQHFHVSSKLRLASLAEEGGETFASRSPFIYALLSDSAEVIDGFAKMDPAKARPAGMAPLHLPFRVHLLQLVLNDDFTDLACKLDIAGQGLDGREGRQDRGQDFFTLLRLGNQEGLESLLLEEARVWEAKLNRGKEVGDALHRQFMAFCAMKVKLCWLKDIPVRIDHPLVPMALMPVRPLPRYDDVYDFHELSAGKGTGPRFMGRLGGWIKGRMG